MRTVHFARAVFIPGMGTWYVRLGKQHGVDVMYPARSEPHAKMQARLINKSLNRDLASLKD